MTLRIACTNQKGGTGKTTTAINLAGALAARDHEVLLVDLDPQGHSTEALGFADLYTADRPSLYHTLVDVDRTALIDDLIVEGTEFDLVPSHEHMGGVESTLTNERRRERRLEMTLDDLDREYDVLLIDCPPNLGLLTDNALLAARTLVVPAQTRSSAKRAIDILFDQIDEIETTFEIEIDLLGVVANEYRRDNQSKAMLQWYRERFGEQRVFVVPTRVALQRAWNAGVSVFEHDESVPDVESAFDGLAARVERAVRRHGDAGSTQGAGSETSETAGTAGTAETSGRTDSDGTTGNGTKNAASTDRDGGTEDAGDWTWGTQESG